MEEQTKTSEDIMSIMTFKIDGNWTALEFQIFFDSINKIYEFNKILSSYYMAYETIGKEFNFANGFENLPRYKEIKYGLMAESKRVFEGIDYDNEYFFQRISRFSFYGLLEVTKIQYASPGGIDFLGMGKFFDIIKELLIHYLPNREKKLDMVLKSKEIEEREQKILQQKIETLKKLGLTPTEIMSIIGLESFHVQKIINLQARGKITDIEIKKESK